MALPKPAEVSYEEKLAGFDETPLFMKTLPEDIFENPAVSALQSLVHDGTPDEIAQNFKEQGNDYFKGKRTREALGFYSQGVDAKPTDKVLLEALLCNRAACNLELTISLNPKSSKAFYRSASALVALERYDEALDCCTKCLAFDPDNKGMEAIRQKTQSLKDAKEKKERERRDKLRREQEEKRLLQIAFKGRNVLVVTEQSTAVNIQFKPHFDPEDPTRNTLVFPVLFLYPQYATSDTIAEFVEDVPFSAHVERMFPPAVPPPSWDAKTEYTENTVVIYAATHRRRLLKVGKKMTLRDVLAKSAGKPGEPTDGLELKDGCLSFVVLPKGDVEKEWIENFKRSRGA